MPRKLLAVLLLPVLLLSACAQIPRNSDVKSGPDLDPQNVTEPIYYSPAGPYDGQSPVQLVTAFITAGTGPQNDYSIARQYLTSDFKSQWNPNSEVLIQTGGVSVKVSEDHSATVTIMVEARVDADGNLHTYQKPVARQLTYSLKQEKMQWRIASGPDLTIVNRPVFDVLFSGYSLYFFDKTHKYLVPELRWFPARASTATRLVNALIAGPSIWLVGAVDKPLPADVNLSIQSVTVSQGIAQINLNSKANSLTNDQLREFKTQVQATLSQLPTVIDVAIYLDDLPRVLTNVAYTMPQSPNTAPLVLGGGELGYLAGSPLQGAQNLIDQTSATDFALSLATRELVMLSASGLHWAKLGQIDRKLVTLDAASALLSPVFDRTGAVWAFSKLLDGQIKIVSRTSSSTVSAQWLGNYERLSYAISEEGSRIAVVATNHFETKLYVAAIIRDSKGTPIQLAEPISFSPAQGTPVAVTWTGENDLAIAYKEADNLPISIYKATLGGNTTEIGTVDSVQSLFVGSNRTTIYALTNQGNLYGNEGYSFKLLATDISAAHLPQ